VGKHAQVFLECSKNEGLVCIVPRVAADSSLVLLASSMVRSILAGGIIRWFTRPAATLRFYHISVRPQLQALVTELTHGACSLQLLRAPTGHRCLFLMPVQVEPPCASLEADIQAARVPLLAKITELSLSQPSN
jgi:hypothetical protein